MASVEHNATTGKSLGEQRLDMKSASKKSTSKLRRLLPILVLTVVVWPSCCISLLPHLGQPYSDPPAGLRCSDLVGTWEARYGRQGVDRLTLSDDGTFRQTYQDWIVEGYSYETPANEWWLERSDDGRVRLHLQGARYYLAGISMAEQDGMRPPGPWGTVPFSFYDPVAEDFLHMVGELVLNIRNDSADELVLLHMWTDSEGGFAIIGGNREEFRRVGSPDH